MILASLIFFGWENTVYKLPICNSLSWGAKKGRTNAMILRVVCCSCRVDVIEGKQTFCVCMIWGQASNNPHEDDPGHEHRVIRKRWRFYPLLCSGHCCVWVWLVNRWAMNLLGVTDQSGAPFPLSGGCSWEPGQPVLVPQCQWGRLPQWGGAGHAADLTTGCLGGRCEGSSFSGWRHSGGWPGRRTGGRGWIICSLGGSFFKYLGIWLNICSSGAKGSVIYFIIFVIITLVSFGGMA